MYKIETPEHLCAWRVCTMNHLLSGYFVRKKGCCRICWASGLLLGSHTSNSETMSANALCSGRTYLCNRLHRSTFRTLVLDDALAGQSSIPSFSRKYFCAALFEECTMFNGQSWPVTCFIIARCSKLSCVGNNISPVYNSMRMHPTDHQSEDIVHVIPKITSGHLYCLVLITDEWWSCSKVAPPKSINLICALRGRLTIPDPREKLWE